MTLENSVDKYKFDIVGITFEYYGSNPDEVKALLEEYFTKKSELYHGVFEALLKNKYKRVVVTDTEDAIFDGFTTTDSLLITMDFFWHDDMYKKIVPDCLYEGMINLANGFYLSKKQSVILRNNSVYNKHLLAGFFSKYGPREFAVGIDEAYYDLLTYCIEKGDFSVLLQILNESDSKRQDKLLRNFRTSYLSEIYTYLLENCGFELLTDIVASKIDDFYFFTNYPHQILEKVDSISGESDSKDKTGRELLVNHLKKMFQMPLSEEKILGLVMETLDYIEPDHSLSDLFASMVRKGVFRIWDSRSIRERQKQVDFFNSTDVDQYFICHYEGEYPVINCPLRHTLSDVRSIIHEFFHFYNMQGRFDKGSSAFELNEFASIFFETVAGNYLLSKEFDEAVVRDLLQWRISDIERIKNRKTFMDLLRTVIEDGEINEENFASVREQLEVQFCRLLKPARYVGNSKLERTLYVVSNFETWKKFSIKLTYVIGAVLTNDIIESKGLTEGSRLVLQNMDKINNINYSVEEVMELFKEDGYTPFAKEQPKVKKIIPPKNSVE